MEEFDRVLRRVDRRLETPEPDRSRILAEMAGDLEDLCEAYRERGMDPEAARRRAVRWFEPSPEATDRLRAIHTPWIERHLRRLGSTARGWVEIGAVATFSLAAAGAGIAGVAASGILAPTLPGAWAVTVIGAAGLGMVAARGYGLFVRGSGSSPDVVRRLRDVLAAAAAAALAGLIAAGLRLTAAPADAATGVPWSDLTAAAALASLGISVALLLALAWLVLRLRASAVRRAVARARSELGDTLPSGGPETTDARETSTRQEVTR
ncbi:MAG: permease prefix domain 1-containing protein [Candidatus Palauibacterales bacterium]|nr:permease prefix domain 1-containing protein [Candidatus Palauibacterales bacterium]